MATTPTTPTIPTSFGDVQPHLQNYRELGSESAQIWRMLTRSMGLVENIAEGFYRLDDGFDTPVREYEECFERFQSVLEKVKAQQERRIELYWALRNISSSIVAENQDVFSPGFRERLDRAWVTPTGGHKPYPLKIKDERTRFIVAHRCISFDASDCKIQFDWCPRTEADLLANMEQFMKLVIGPIALDMQAWPFFIEALEQYLAFIKKNYEDRTK